MNPAVVWLNLVLILIRSAIGNTFCEGRHPDQILAVGSVKSSIGHLESASGLAGIIKAVLILEKGIIPPVANIEKLKSGLPLKSTIKVRSNPSDAGTYHITVFRSQYNVSVGRSKARESYL